MTAARRRRLLVAAAVAGVALLPPGAVGQEPAAPIAGATLHALSAGVRFQLNSPALLPVGDALEGNIVELNGPFARVNMSQGPVIDALGSPAYPGDTVASVGTAIATFSDGQLAPPNPPVSANAKFPPTPTNSQDETYGEAGVGAVRSRAGEEGGSVHATITEFGLDPLVKVASATADGAVTLRPSLVTSAASSEVGTIVIADVIRIEGVKATASASSNGTEATPAARLEIGRVTVAGAPAYIDEDGIHLLPDQPLGTGIVPGLEAMLNGILNQDNITVRAASPRTVRDGGMASADSGGLAVIIQRTAPALGVPGVPALEIPGVPPVPLGTPALPLHIELWFGHARALAHATVAPGLEPTGEVAGGPTIAPGPEISGAAVLPIVGEGASRLPRSPQAVGPGAVPQLTGLPGDEVPRGRPIPVVWVIVAVAAAIVASSPLLGYARWQLLEGRNG